MSIQTLKKKTLAKYNNNSVGVRQFSIVGTHRNQGYIGQDTLGRTILKTPFRGNTPRGNGGCCGTYPVSILTPYGTCSVEDSSVVKPSVLSNYGSIATHYRWIRRPAPYTSVKPDDNLELNAAESAYTERLRNRVLQSIDTYDQTHSTTPPVRVLPPGLPAQMPCPPITKEVVGNTPQSIYLLSVNEQCTANDNKQPASIGGTPLPGQ
jgi:hypothetical protein